MISFFLCTWTQTNAYFVSIFVFFSFVTKLKFITNIDLPCSTVFLCVPVCHHEGAINVNLMVSTSLLFFFSCFAQQFIFCVLLRWDSSKDRYSEIENTLKWSVHIHVCVCERFKYELPDIVLSFSRFLFRDLWCWDFCCRSFCFRFSIWMPLASIKFFFSNLPKKIRFFEQILNVDFS